MGPGKCQKTATVDATWEYRCPGDGYELSGTSCVKTLYESYVAGECPAEYQKISPNKCWKKTTQLATAEYVPLEELCPVGYQEVGPGKCQKTVRVDATVDATWEYRCPGDGYELSGTSCVKTLYESYVAGECPAGYQGVGPGKCQKTVTTDDATVTNIGVRVGGR